MKCKALFVAFVLLVSGRAYQAHADSGVQTKYDEVMKEIVVSQEVFYGSHWISSKPQIEERFRLLAMYIYPGKKPVKPGNLGFSIARQVRQKTGYDEKFHCYLYPDVNKLTLTVDGKSESFESMQLPGHYSWGQGNLFEEKNQIAISVALLQKMVQAKKVEVGLFKDKARLGTMSFDPKALKLFAGFLKSIPK